MSTVLRLITTNGIRTQRRPPGYYSQELVKKWSNTGDPVQPLLAGGTCMSIRIYQQVDIAVIQLLCKLKSTVKIKQ